MRNKKTRDGVVIGGYYGFGNLGDEAILDSAVRALCRVMPPHSICVLSASPEKTAKKFGVCSIKRTDIISVIRKMCSASLYISGGGGLIQDATSRRSLWYYSGLMHLGKRLCGHMLVLANGVGAVMQTKLAARSLLLADRVSVRDAASRERLSAWGVSAEVCADPVFALPVGREKRERYGYFAVCLRRGEMLDFNTLSAFCSIYRRRGLQAMFISMQEEDDVLCRSAADYCGGRFVSPQSFDFLVYLLSGAEFAVGMRLHFLIGAARAEVPFLSLGGDCKLRDFISHWGCGADCLTTTEEAVVLSAKVDAACTAHSEYAKERSDKLSEMSALAESELENLCRMCVALCGDGEKKEISLGEI